jgi:hypothetical protein
MYTLYVDHNLFLDYMQLSTKMLKGVFGTLIKEIQMVI